MIIDRYVRAIFSLSTSLTRLLILTVFAIAYALFQISSLRQVLSNWTTRSVLNLVFSVGWPALFLWFALFVLVTSHKYYHALQKLRRLGATEGRYMLRRDYGPNPATIFVVRKGPDIALEVWPDSLGRSIYRLAINVAGGEILVCKLGMAVSKVSVNRTSSRDRMSSEWQPVEMGNLQSLKLLRKTAAGLKRP